MNQVKHLENQARFERRFAGQWMFQGRKYRRNAEWWPLKFQHSYKQETSTVNTAADKRIWPGGTDRIHLLYANPLGAEVLHQHRVEPCRHSLTHTNNNEIWRANGPGKRAMRQTREDASIAGSWGGGNQSLFDMKPLSNETIAFRPEKSSVSS